MALPIYTVFIISMATLFINVNGCGEVGATECGCNNPTTTQRTIEIVRVREPERRPLPEYIDDRRLPPVVLRPTIQKYFVFPQNSQATRYPRPYPIGNGGGYFMLPVAVKRKTIKKSSTEKST